jgi:hypothetical protein
MDTSASILSAQYNNLAVVPEHLAKNRGSGNYNTQGTSNWPIGKSNVNTTYLQDVYEDYNGPRGQEYNLSYQAPVGDHQNDHWEYSSDQGSSLPQSKESPLGDPYLQFGLTSLKEEVTELSGLFFSKVNVDYLQNRIVTDVKKITGYDIKPQNESALLIIMRNKYQYGLSGWLPATSPVHLALPRGEKTCSLKERLSRLNQAVLQNTIKQVIDKMEMYAEYYKQASSMPEPLTLPTSMTMKGSRVLQENIAFTNGNSRGIDSFNMRNNII